MTALEQAARQAWEHWGSWAKHTVCTGCGHDRYCRSQRKGKWLCLGCFDQSMTKRSKREKLKRAEEAKLRQVVRDDMQQQPDHAPGTSPASLGLVKAASEEARLETCFECGYSGGRHARLCPRR